MRVPSRDAVAQCPGHLPVVVDEIMVDNVDNVVVVDNVIHIDLAEVTEVEWQQNAVQEYLNQVQQCLVRHGKLQSQLTVQQPARIQLSLIKHQAQEQWALVRSPGACGVQQQLTLCMSGVDYTKIPKQLDAKFEELDVDSALRPTIIKPGTLWTHKSQKVSEQLCSSISVQSAQ